MEAIEPSWSFPIPIPILPQEYMLNVHILSIVYSLCEVSADSFCVQEETLVLMRIVKWINIIDFMVTLK